MPHLSRIETEQRAPAARCAESLAESARVVARAQEWHGFKREQEPRADVIAEHDRTQDLLAREIARLADRERRRHDARAGMRERRRMRIVGFIRMPEHAVRERRVRGRSHDARADDARLRFAAERSHVLDRLLAGQQTRARKHRRKRIDDVKLGAPGNGRRQLLAQRRGDVGAERLHQRRNLRAFAIVKEYILPSGAAGKKMARRSAKEQGFSHMLKLPIPPLLVVPFRMQITAIHSIIVPIASDIRNAYIDFSKMTASVVAVVTDVKRNGKPVVGYGFNSNGRYAQAGLLAERFIPRVMGAEPASLLNDEGTNLDPHRIWACMMANEKPGGHGERSVAVGVIDMAVWDAVAKIEGKPLYRLLAERYNGGQVDDKVFVYAAGGYYYPGKNVKALQDEMRKYLDLGYSVVKMKIGGESLADDLKRIDAVIDLVGSPKKVAVDANGRFDLATAVEYAKALEPYGLFWYEEAGDPLDFQLQAELRESLQRADGDRREPVLDAGRAQSHPLRRHAPRSRLAAVRLRAVLRPRGIPANARDAEGARLVGSAVHSARRPPDVAQHCRGARARRERIVSGRLSAVRRFC